MTEKRKRAAPTIDLKATEVPGAAQGKTAPQETASAPPPPPEAPPRSEQPPPPPPPPPPAAAEASSPPSDFIKTIAMPLAAGFAGAMLGGAVVWGLLPRAGNDGGQIAALRKQVQELQTRPAAAPDTQAVDALRGRLDKVEHDVVSLPPGDKSVADRLAAADGAMKSLGIALAALNKRNDDAAANAKQADERAAAAEKAVGELRDSVQSAKQQASAAADAGQLAAVQNRIDVLDQAVKEARTQIAANATTDKAARLALSAAALRDAVERGTPYTNELAQAKAIGADDKDLAALAPFAASGVPSAPALARELAALMPALVKTADVQGASQGFLDRLQANAGRLVRISPVDAPQGDRPADVLARLEVDAAHADIAAARSDIGKLPDRARQQAADWLAKATARDTALAAARKVASDAARALGQ